MNISKNKLIEHAQNYINDSISYDETSKSTLTENILKPFTTKLITESKKDTTKLINEHFQKQNLEGKEIIDDFLTYIENLD